MTTVECPQCHTPVTVAETPYLGLVCPACGAGFWGPPDVAITKAGVRMQVWYATQSDTIVRGYDDRTG